MHLYLVSFFLYLACQVGLNVDDFGMILLKNPWILSTSILINSEKILQFFENEKVLCFYLFHCLVIVFHPFMIKAPLV